MLSSQIPTRSRNSSDTPVKIAMLRPATRQARTQATATNTRKGTASNAASKPPRIWSTGHCRALKNGRMFGDRKSVVSGKSVSVRVDLGGRRISKQKKKAHTKTTVQNTAKQTEN